MGVFTFLSIVWLQNKCIIVLVSVFQTLGKTSRISRKISPRKLKPCQAEPRMSCLQDSYFLSCLFVSLFYQQKHWAIKETFSVLAFCDNVPYFGEVFYTHPFLKETCQRNQSPGSITALIENSGQRTGHMCYPYRTNVYGLMNL